MTATPHSGDEDRFQNFLACSTPTSSRSRDLAKRADRSRRQPVLPAPAEGGPQVDEHGARALRPAPGHDASRSSSQRAGARALRGGHRLHPRVPRRVGRPAAGTAVALARTVLQRRLASSLGAIRSSLAKRAERIAERDRGGRATASRRAAPSGSPSSGDAEDSDDRHDRDRLRRRDERRRTSCATGVVVAETLDAMRAEIVALRAAGRQPTRRSRRWARRRKLTALRGLPRRSRSFAELEDGRGKLLIFTEHRDTLDYLEQHLREWGYTICSIHGGIPPTERKQIQQDFRPEQADLRRHRGGRRGDQPPVLPPDDQLRPAVEPDPAGAADGPHPPHRPGARRATSSTSAPTNTVEGKLLHRLLEKLEEMRRRSAGASTTSIGELLTLNGVDFERLLRETLLNPDRIDAAEREIERHRPPRTTRSTSRPSASRRRRSTSTWAGCASATGAPRSAV